MKLSIHLQQIKTMLINRKYLSLGDMGFEMFKGTHKGKLVKCNNHSCLLIQSIVLWIKCILTIYGIDIFSTKNKLK
jgi:hypothetical protein